MNMLTVWFIRHAESEANAGLRSSNPAEIALTAKRIGQTKYIKAYFDSQPSLIITSPYKRTKQSAEPVIEKFQSSYQEEWPVQDTYLSPLRCQHTTANERRPIVKIQFRNEEEIGLSKVISSHLPVTIISE